MFPPATSFTLISLLVQSEVPVRRVVMVLWSLFTFTSRLASVPSSSTRVIYFKPDPSGRRWTDGGTESDSPQRVRLTDAQPGDDASAGEVGRLCLMMNGSKGWMLAFKVKYFCSFGKGSTREGPASWLQLWL